MSTNFQTVLLHILTFYDNFRTKSAVNIDKLLRNRYNYRNDPKFSDRQVWAQCRPRSDCRVYTVCIFWMHYSTVKPSCLNFRVITANFSGVRIFRIFTVIPDFFSQNSNEVRYIYSNT